MARKLLPLVLTLLLAACAGEQEIANCKGPVVALNPTHWSPSPALIHAFNEQKGAP